MHDFLYFLTKWKVICLYGFASMKKEFSKYRVYKYRVCLRKKLEVKMSEFCPSISSEGHTNTIIKLEWRMELPPVCTDYQYIFFSHLEVSEYQPYVFVSQNHRMAEFGQNLWMPAGPTCLFKQCHLRQVYQVCVQMGFLKYL